MTETQQIAPKDFGWVLLELMGHRQRIGKACEEEVAGSRLLRIDIPTDDDDQYVTEYYGASSIYAMRPITEEVAKDHYAKSDPRPTKPAAYRPSHQIADHSYDDDVDEPNF